CPPNSKAQRQPGISPASDLRPDLVPSEALDRACRYLCPGKLHRQVVSDQLAGALAVFSHSTPSDKSRRAASPPPTASRPPPQPSAPTPETPPERHPRHPEYGTISAGIPAAPSNRAAAPIPQRPIARPWR